MTLAGRLAAALERAWWQTSPGGLAQALRPLSWLYRGLSGLDRWLWTSGWRKRPHLPLPVLVIGNLIIGGAGKTPTTLAVIEQLKRSGWHPGVISRGYGRRGQAVLEVTPDLEARLAGDEPLLIRLRAGVPVFVGNDRAAAALALHVAHPEVDLLVSDDGLQHHRLRRDLALLVFDSRGAGNGLLLPAGPLRQPLPGSLPGDTLLLYNADRPSTDLPGACAQRKLGGAVGLAEWWQGQAASPATLEALAHKSQANPVLAAAGMAAPERFFGMLEQRGLVIRRMPLPDHSPLDPAPWPASTTDVLVTEKDAVKLRPGAQDPTRVWVIALDFHLPPDFALALQHAVARLRPEPS